MQKMCHMLAEECYQRLQVDFIIPCLCSSTPFSLYLQLMVGDLLPSSTMLRMALTGLVELAKELLLDTMLVMTSDTSSFQDH